MTQQLQVLRENKILLNTAYDATVQQNRIFMYIIYNLQVQHNDQGVCSCTIATEEFKEIISDKNKRSVEGVNELLDQLVKTTLRFGNTKQEHTYTLIAGYQYDELSDRYRIQVVQKLYEHVIESITNEHSVEIQKLLTLKTRYAQKLFEVLDFYRQGQTEGMCKLELTWIKCKLGVEANQYTRYTSFKTRVLDIAVRGINDAAVLNVRYEEIKEKRQVVQISFNFRSVDKIMPIQTEMIGELEENAENVTSRQQDDNVAIEDSGITQKEIDREKQETAMNGMLEDLSMSRSLYPSFIKAFKHLDFISDVVINILLYAEARTLEETDKDWIGEDEYAEFKKWIQYYQQHTELFG